MDKIIFNSLLGNYLIFMINMIIYNLQEKNKCLILLSNTNSINCINIIISKLIPPDSKEFKSYRIQN